MNCLRQGVGGIYEERIDDFVLCEYGLEIELQDKSLDQNYLHVGAEDIIVMKINPPSDEAMLQ